MDGGALVPPLLAGARVGAAGFGAGAAVGAAGLGAGAASRAGAGAGARAGAGGAAGLAAGRGAADPAPAPDRPAAGPGVGEPRISSGGRYTTGEPRPAMISRIVGSGVGCGIWVGATSVLPAAGREQPALMRATSSAPIATPASERVVCRSAHCAVTHASRRVAQAVLTPTISCEVLATGRVSARKNVPDSDRNGVNPADRR